MYKHTQRSFTGGVIDRELMGRQDLERYFKGASVLRNFLVRRQGNLSKRRGTDEAADLANLLGYNVVDGENVPIAIREARLFPLVYSRDEGFHLVVSNRRAFLASRRGIRAETHAWLRSITPYEAVDYAGRGSVRQAFAVMIGNDGYDTLEEALAAANDGDVLTLGGDDDIVVDTQLKCTTTGSVTLNLNGRRVVSTIASPTQTSGAFRVETGSSLTIEDTVGGGRIEQPESIEEDLFFVATGATLTIKSGSIIARAKYNINNNVASWRAAILVAGTVNVEGGVVANEGAEPVGIDDGALVPDNAIFRFTSTSGHERTVRISGGLLRGGDFTQSFYGSGFSPINNCLLIGSQATSAAIDVEISGGFVAAHSIGGKPLAASQGGETVYCSDNTPADGLRILISGGANCFKVPGTEWWSNNLFVEGGEFYYNVPLGDSPEGLDWHKPPLWRTRTITLSPWVTSEHSVRSYYYANTSPVEADWTTDDAHWAGGGEEPVPAPTARPYYIDVPWDDSDLAELDYYQSGDTIFFAHKAYPPSRILFHPSSHTLDYAALDFGGTWLPPVLADVDLTNINKTTRTCSASSTTITTYDKETGLKTTTVQNTNQQTQNSTSHNQPLRTVKYCVSYVKDGAESPPSNALEATYVAPWAEGDKITLVFNKGGNASQPDEYRIYKKEGTDFGLIGVVPNTNQRKLLPTAEFKGESAFVTRGSFAPDGGAADDFGAPVGDDVATRHPASCSEQWTLSRLGAHGEYSLAPGVGGVSVPADSVAELSFGQSANAAVASITAYVDAHSLRYVETDGGLKVYDEMALSGAKILCKVFYRDASGSAISNTVLSAGVGNVSYTPEGGGAEVASVGTVTHYAGVVAADAASDVVAAQVGKKPRAAVFSLSSALREKRVVRVQLYATDASGARVPLVLAGVKFTPAASIASTFDDEYISPDMSQTPVDPTFPFSGEGDYPSCVGIHQQRLVFASSRNDPATIWFSATGDLYDFSPHKSIREDDPMTVSLAATELPDVNHMVVSRDVIALAAGGEWKVSPVSGNTLTFKTVSATLQSRCGSSRRLKPLLVGDEIVFADGSEMGLLATKYNYASDGYESTDLTVVSSNLFRSNRIRQMAYEQFPDSRIKCVLADGRAAVMAYMPEHEVAAWSEVVLGGAALAKGVSDSKAIVGTTSDTVYLVVQGGAWRLWAVRPDLPDMTVAAQVSLDGVMRLSGADALAAWRDGWVAVDALTAQVHRSADGLAAGRDYLCGFPFVAAFATVRPEPQGGGTIQFEIKNAKDAEVRVLDGGSWRAAPFGYADHPVYAQKAGAAPAADGGALALDSSDRTVLLSGANSGDGRVEVRSDDAWPLSILSISVNYEIQPLSNSEG